MPPPKDRREIPPVMPRGLWEMSPWSFEIVPANWTRSTTSPTAPRLPPDRCGKTARPRARNLMPSMALSTRARTLWKQLWPRQSHSTTSIVFWNGRGYCWEICLHFLAISCRTEARHKESSSRCNHQEGPLREDRSFTLIKQRCRIHGYILKYRRISQKSEPDRV